MKLLVITLLIVLSPFASAGSADALITGVTSSGRTKVEVSVGDVDGLIRSIKLTIDAKTYSFVPDDCTVIRDKENKIYVLIAESEGYSFRMWMIPGSEKVVSATNHSLHTTFAAVIQATDPRKTHKWQYTPKITIGCKLSYSI